MSADASNVPSWVTDLAKESNPTQSSPDDRNKRAAAFNNRKGLKNRLKNRKNKKGQRARNNRRGKSSSQTVQRIHRKDPNYGFNNDVTDNEEVDIYRSISTAISMHNRLSDDELYKIIQRALNKLNAAWFRENIFSFFKPLATNPLMGDAVSLILRLFTLHFDLKNTRHSVPFRFLLLDLISPSLHARSAARRNAMLLEPLPPITNVHRARALEIFSLWILEMTQSIDKADWSSISKNSKYLKSNASSNPFISDSNDIDSKESKEDSLQEVVHAVSAMNIDPESNGNDNDDVDSKENSITPSNPSIPSTLSMPSTPSIPTAASTASTTSTTSNAVHDIFTNEVSLDLLQKYKNHTLCFLTSKEMECLFHAFSLNEILPHRIRSKLCDKAFHLLHDDRDAPHAIEWTLYFDLPRLVPYQLILAPVLRKQSELHYALNFADSLSVDEVVLKEEVKRFIVSCISELMAKNETNISPNRAMKLIEIWKFNLEDFEPLVESQIENFLKWTIYKGHIDDYAVTVCSHSDTLKRWVIQQCHHHPTTYSSCIKWAEHWNMHNEDGLKSLVDHSREWLSKHDLEAEEYEKRKQQAFNDRIDDFDDLEFVDIDLDSIFFVDDLESLQMARTVLLDERVEVLGLDLELMSVELPIKKAPSHCQILQIATDEKAFIFDLQCLDALEGWDDLLADIFESEAVKVGMAWQGDLCNLQKQWPDSIAFKAVCSPYLELQTIAKHMRNDGEFLEKQPEWVVLDEEKEKKIKNRFKRNHEKEGGLAKIVRWVLRKRLNKHEQLSNWSRRPLRPEQLKYAALDSMVECQLWRKFKEWETETLLPPMNGFYENLYGQTN